MDTEVVITGIGLVTPLGTTAPATNAAWCGGAQAARGRLAELAGTLLETCTVGLLPAFDPAARLGGRRMLKYMSDATVLGCLAAREAAADAALKERFAPEAIGLFAGSGLAAASVQDVLPMLENSVGPDGKFSCRLLGEKGLSAANPLLSFKILANMPPCLVSLLEGIKGPNLIFTPWEGQTAAALQEGWRAVAEGQVDAALVGAADNPAHPATFVFLRSSGRLAPDEYASPAAAYLVLERAHSARRSARRVYAQLLPPRLHLAPGPVHDPLSARLGRTFAAAPAVLLALRGMSGEGYGAVSGGDGHRFRIEVRAWV